MIDCGGPGQGISKGLKPLGVLSILNLRIFPYVGVNAPLIFRKKEGGLAGTLGLLAPPKACAPGKNIFFCRAKSLNGELMEGYR